MSQSNWKKSLAGLFIVIAIFFGVMDATNFERRELGFAEKLYKDTLAPLQSGVMNVSQSISSYFKTLMELRDLKDRNKVLEKEVDNLRGQLAEMENLRFDNLRYRELLRFKDRSLDKFRIEGAEVIAKSPENLFSMITINKGYADGIRKDMVVISPLGLVGHVVGVTNSTAQVLLILDPRSGVSSLLQTSRATGVVEGIAHMRNMVRMIYIPEDAAIRVGDTVISSGLGGIFPKGLPIGKVIEFEREPGGLTQRAIIETSVNFSYLEEVFIIKDVFVIEEDLVDEENDNVDEDDNVIDNNNVPTEVPGEGE